MNIKTWAKLFIISALTFGAALLLYWVNIWFEWYKYDSDLGLAMLLVMCAAAVCALVSLVCIIVGRIASKEKTSPFFFHKTVLVIELILFVVWMGIVIGDLSSGDWSAGLLAIVLSIAVGPAWLIILIIDICLWLRKRKKFGLTK